MIYKKILVFILIIFSILLVNQKKVYATPLEKTLILYNNSLECEKSLDSLELVFKADFQNITMETINNYQLNQINEYSNIIILNGENNITNENLIIDLKKSNKKVCFIGNDFGKILNNDLEKENTIVTNLNYDGNSYPLSLEGEFTKIINLNQNELKAYFSDGLSKYPYIISYKNKLLISKLPTSKILSDIFFKEFYNFFNLKNNSIKEISITLSLNNEKDINSLVDYSKKLKYNGYSFYVIIPNNFLDQSTKNDIKKLKYIESIGGNLIISAKSNENIQYYKELVKNFALNGLYITGIRTKNSNEIDLLKNNFSTILYDGNNENEEDLNNIPFKLNLKDSNIIFNNLNINNSSLEKFKYYYNLLPEGSYSNIIIPVTINNENFMGFFNYIYDENIKISKVSKENLVSLDGVVIKEENNKISSTVIKEKQEQTHWIVGKINDILIIAIMIICIILTIIFFYYSYLNKKKFLR